MTFSMLLAFATTDPDPDVRTLARTALERLAELEAAPTERAPCVRLDTTLADLLARLATRIGHASTIPAPAPEVVP